MTKNKKWRCRVKRRAGGRIFWTPLLLGISVPELQINFTRVGATGVAEPRPVRQAVVCHCASPFSPARMEHPSVSVVDPLTNFYLLFRILRIGSADRADKEKAFLDLVEKISAAAPTVHCLSARFSLFYFPRIPTR